MGIDVLPRTQRDGHITASCAGASSIEACELTARSSHGRGKVWPPRLAQVDTVKIMLKLFKSKPALTFLGS